MQSGNKDDLYYAYTDHLGSLVAIADGNGNVVERFAYIGRNIYACITRYNGCPIFTDTPTLL
ncbi:hypothetical protein [Anaerophaga thermohalophila]|uniref:hypothetical protein n=1 Tax=Anaerophaga thermohalophila TaxID=177400 RepID=UPI000237C48A|nr:hypothetical protein [Anaerophaga thermohalophila]